MQNFNQMFVNKDCIPWEPYHVALSFTVIPNHKLANQDDADTSEKITDAIYNMMGIE